MAHSSHAALDLGTRWPKAEKIRRLLDAAFAGGPRRVLEIGTGSGAIAHYFSRVDDGAHEVRAVDVADQRQVSDGFRFDVYDGRHLPFADRSFDVVISNHVIEHVGSRAEQAAHLAEIGRVLVPGGCAYLAAPSRWQVVEPHFHLPFLSWLPPRWRDAYVRLAGKGNGYDCNPLAHAGLERLLAATGLSYRNVNAAALALTLQLELQGHWLASAAGRIPRSILQHLYRGSPTMVYLLRKGNGADESLPIPVRP